MMKLSTIDWKMIASIELSNFQQQITENQRSVDEIATMISHANIDDEFSQADPNLIKLFRLSQILLSHFIEKNCQRVSASKSTGKDLASENRKLRRILLMYQKTFGIERDEKNENRHLQCPHCPKSFYDVNFLENHCLKRHPQNGLESEGLFALQERIADYNSSIFFSNTKMNELHRELEQIRTKLDETERNLSLEREARSQLETKIEEIDRRAIEAECEAERDDEKLTEKTIEIEDINETPKDLQNLIILQTKEVRNLGVKLEKLVDNLIKDRIPQDQPEKVVIRSSNQMKVEMEPEMIKPTINHEKIEVKPNFYESRMKNTPKSVSIDDFRPRTVKIIHSNFNITPEPAKLEDSIIEKLTENEKFDKINQEVEQILNGFGIDPRSDEIDCEKFDLLMEKIEEKRKLEQISSEKSRETLMARIEADLDMKTREIDKKMSPESSEKIDQTDVKMRKDEKPQRPKSLLIKRDSEGNRLKKSLSKKISFNEKRIEISPSDDDDDYKQLEMALAEPPIPKARTSIEKNHDIDWLENEDETDDQKKLNVNQLTKIIERRLSGRNDTKPVNSVDTLSKNTLTMTKTGEILNYLGDSD